MTTTTFANPCIHVLELAMTLCVEKWRSGEVHGEQYSTYSTYMDMDIDMGDAYLSRSSFSSFVAVDVTTTTTSWLRSPSTTSCSFQAEPWNLPDPFRNGASCNRL
jgi:hypothetical protein